MPLWIPDWVFTTVKWVGLVTGLLVVFGIFTYGVMALIPDELSSGTVIRKHYEPEREFVMIIPMQVGETCYGSGTTRTCTPNYIYIPWVFYDDPDYVLGLEQKQEDGKIKKGIAYVTQTTYERLQIGDFYDKKVEGGGSADPNVRMRRK